MDRAMPTSSRIVTNAVTYKNMSIHYDKLNRMKPVLRQETPVAFHPKKKEYTKRFAEKERLREIERENNFLMQKLTTLMTPSERNHSSEYYTESSNRLNRKKDLVRITRENQGIMKRIVSQKSHYDRDGWKKDQVKNEEYLKNLSDYGFVNDHFYEVSYCFLLY